MKKKLFGKVIFGAALLVGVNCYALTLGQIGNWDTSAELPKVVKVIDQVLSQPLSPAQKNQLGTLKKHVIDLQTAEHNIKVTLDVWNKLNEELSKIHHTGVDKQSHPYAWSGHTTAEGKPEPRWEKVQADQRNANAEAADKRQIVKATIRDLEPDLKDKLEELLIK